jgi:ubiquinone/menaquinone biosynthesis C-methylase UbiE
MADSSFLRSTEHELMDGPGLDPDELAANLRDIRRVNRLLGGTSIVLRHLPALLDGIPLDERITILDLATGSGDIPLAIVKWAESTGCTVEIIASDVSPLILAVAREHVGCNASVKFAQYDARDVPLPDRCVDVVLCSLALHHFQPDGAVLVLREMQRLARVGFIVNDLYRSRAGYVAAWLAARLTTRNRLTRHDAPLSVRRAYTPDELRDLLHRAGIDGARISNHRWFRMAAVVRTEWRQGGRRPTAATV